MTAVATKRPDITAPQQPDAATATKSRGVEASLAGALSPNDLEKQLASHQAAMRQIMSEHQHSLEIRHRTAMKQIENLARNERKIAEQELQHFTYFALGMIVVIVAVVALTLHRLGTLI